MMQSNRDQPDAGASAILSWPTIKLKLPLVLGYFFSAGSLAISGIAQLVSFAVLARHLGVEQFGVLVTITAATNVGMQLCGLGATETVVRRVAADPTIYREAIGHHLILIGASGSVLVLILAAALPRFITVSSDGFTNFTALLAFVVSNVVLARWIFVTEQVFISRFEFGAANLANIGFALARAFTVVLACYGFGLSQLSDWALWHGGCHLLVAAVCTAILSRFGWPRWTILPNETQLGIFFCTPYFFKAIRQNIDLLVLSFVATPDIIGSFSVARRILDTSTLTVSGLHRLTYPKLAVVNASGFASTLALARKLLIVVFAIAGSTSISIFMLAPILPRLFGSGFSETITYTRALCWIGVLLGAQEMAAEALGASGQHGLRATIYNVGSIVGSFLVAAMTYKFLLGGAIVAFYVIECLIAIAFWIIIIAMSKRVVTFDAT